MNRSGFVIANQQAEYLADYRDIGGAIMRAWCKTPERALRFKSMFSAQRAIKKSGIDGNAKALAVWESETRIAVEWPVEAWGRMPDRAGATS